MALAILRETIRFRADKYGGPAQNSLGPYQVNGNIEKILKTVER